MMYIVSFDRGDGGYPHRHNISIAEARSNVDIDHMNADILHFDLIGNLKSISVVGQVVAEFMC